LFPQGLTGVNRYNCDNTVVVMWHSFHRTRLISGIVSTALQCGNEQCPTNTLELNTPVVVTIHHSEEVEVSQRVTLTSVH
jgi:hypothetical protein